MTIDLDELLTESAPDVTVLSGVGPAMAATARAVSHGEGARPARVRRRSVSLASVAAVAVLGVGATATAASLWRTAPEGPWDSDPVIVTKAFPELAADCVVELRFGPTGQPHDVEGVSDDAWRDALAYSQDFLRNIDVNEIPTAAQVHRYRAMQDEALRDIAPDERPPAESRGEILLNTFAAQVTEQLNAGLAAHDLPQNVVGSATSYPMSCIGSDQ
ncbi:MAG: hypothetical protein QM655_08320 [Nocardioidaceae bacterium]